MRSKIFVGLIFFGVMGLLVETSGAESNSSEPSRAVGLAPNQKVQPLKVLMIMGGCCHDFKNQAVILSNGLSARINVEVSAVVEGETREHQHSVYSKPDWAIGFDVILHNECFGMVKDDAFVERIAAAHESGIPGVMLHCSTHSYRTAATDAWRKTLGVSSYSHEKKRDLLVTNVAPQHPIMKNFPQTWPNPNDEMYKVEKFWPTATSLAEAYGEETKKNHVCVWINQHGKGKIFATTLGHENATMEQGVYLDLVARGLLWACGKLESNGEPHAGYAKNLK
jgi:type 1 glutamine amidotransferase